MAAGVYEFIKGLLWEALLWSIKGGCVMRG
jgi:hypothetical protein